MPYQFTCPLCLRTLGQRQFLKLFKLADAGSYRNDPPKRIDCSNPDFIDEILQFSGEDTFVPIDEHAVYVSHERCSAVNPFWTNNQLDMPGQDTDGEQFTANLKCITTDQTFQSELSYWMVKILRETYKLGNDYRSMWYPLPLLLATAADGNPRTRPYGSLVEMASSKSVGKTILTLQILNQALYRNGREVTVRDFFYPNADLDDNQLDRFREKFYIEVFYHSMWKRMPVSRPFGTIPSAGDLRAIFVQPVRKDDQPVQAAAAPANGRVKRGVSFAYKMLKIFTKETLLIKSEEKKDQSGLKFEDLVRKRKDEYWSPIIFYDTAGELQKTMSNATRAVRQLTNKLAICVDAREIFNRYEPLMPEEKITPVSERNASIIQAHKRLAELEMAPSRKRPTCIIVTKLDVVLDETEKERVKQIAEAENPEANESARKLLMEWLKAHPDSDKQNLLSLIAKEPRVVDHVFFVWTENLPRMKGVRRSPIKTIDPPSAAPGAEIILEAEKDFNFDDAKRVTFNGIESRFTIESNEKIKAIVPDTATSGLVGILLEGIARGVGQTSTAYRDDATSNDPFTVLPQLSSDASKPRSYGLIKFLAWCLDKKIEEISRPTGY